MKKCLLITSVVASIFSISWLWGLPSCFTMLKPHIYQYVEKKFGYTIKDSELSIKTSLLPYLNISANNFEITNPYKNSVIKTQNSKLKLELIPILVGKFHAKDIITDNIELNLYLDEPILKDDKTVKFLKNFTFNAHSINLKKYNFNIAPIQNKRGIIAKGENLQFSNTNSKKNIKCNTTIEINNRLSSLETDITIPKYYNPKETKAYISIKDFDIAPIHKIFSKSLPNDLLRTNGILNINLKDRNLTVTIDNLNLIFKEDFKNIKFPKTVTCNGEFELYEKEIIFAPLSIKGNNLNLNSNLSIKDFSTKKPIIKASLGVENTRTETLVKMLPAIKSKDFNLFYLKKSPLYGDINGHLTLDGKITQPHVQGDILIKNAFLAKTLTKGTKLADINLNFKNNKIYYEVLLATGINEDVSIKGNTELTGDKNSEISIKTANVVDLAIAKSILDPLRKILYFETGPVPIMKLDGKSSINLQIQGNKLNPHVWGDIIFKNSNAAFAEIKNLELKNLDGFVKFDNQDINFKLNKAKLNGENADISGTGNLLGDISVKISTKNFNLQKGYEAILTSPMLNDIKRLFPPLTNLKGSADLALTFAGNIPDIENIIFNKNLFAKGFLNIHNTSAEYKDVILSGINGDINFDQNNININAISSVNNSQISIKGNIENDIANIAINSPSLNLKEILQNPHLKNLADNNYISFNSTYKGKISEIELNKLEAEGKILAPSKNSPISVSKGAIKIKGGTCSIDNISGFITGNPFLMKAKITNLGKNNQNINANISLKEANLSTINLIREFYLLPQETRELLRKLDFTNGKTNIDLKVINNRPFTDFKLNNVEITYLPLEMPIKIINGDISLKNNIVEFKKINTLADEMPIFIDGQINNIYNKPYHDIYINSVPKQAFIDKYLNKNSLYPLKIKGDIIYSANVKGVADLYNIIANAKIEAQSSIYYLGATLGENENPTIIDFNGDIVKNNSIKINNFEYNKSVASQNNKQNLINFLKVKGLVKLKDKEPFFQNLSIKTENPTDARIFNVIFKKPNIKQGLFTSDIKINGRLSDLKILGDFNIFEIDLPLMQTILKNIALKFEPNTIKINAKGEIFSNEINFKAEMLNRLKEPFIIKNGELAFHTLDINTVIADLKKLEINRPKQDKISQQEISLAALVIENLEILANNILIKGISAQNFKSIITLSEKMNLALNDFSLNLANGNISGDFSYNLLSNKASLLMNAEKINANELSIMLFDLPNQIYGDLTGTVQLTCNATSNKTCSETLYGNGVFNVKDGRMPKLGSLEYLLKAGNLVKGGITGLSINSLIDIITPLKTGNFSDIYGSIEISKGIADNISITTKGENLNLYIKGNCNLVTTDAQMFVYGLLTRQIKTPLGAIGNISINTLFNLIPGINLEAESPILNDINKIPGIELSQKEFRKFLAEIRGDISGDNYVKSFKWIN